LVAAATENMQLGTSVYLLPLRPPTITAKVTSTLDILSGGRLTLGIGVGGEFPPEFEACGVPVNERGRRTDESIEIIRRLWTEDKVSYQGKHFNFGPVSIDPKPLQPGGPKILVGGRKGPTFRRAGQLGDGYMSHMCSTEQFQGNMQEISRQAAKAERDNVNFETAAFLFTFIDDNYEKALDRATAMLEKIYNRPFRDAAAKYCLLGRSENILEQIQQFVDVGVRSFIFSVPERQDEFIQVFKDQIRPMLDGIQI
jgi:probable F420-dependent oxidoreductase